MPPICCIWRSWSARSSRSNWPLASFLAMRSALAWSSSAAAFSTSATTSPWPEDAAGDAAGVEDVERVDLLAGAEELDRQAGDRAHGERRAAAAVAVGAGQHQAGQRQALVEGLGGAHRVLAGQAVGHQQGLGRAARCGRSPPPRSSSPRPAWCARRCRGSARRSRRAWRPRARGGRCRRRSGRRRSAGSRPRPAWPRMASCSMAAGRRMSSEAISTFLRSVFAQAQRRAWPACVVLPEPCRPAIRITVGGLSARLQRLRLARRPASRPGRRRRS